MSDDLETISLDDSVGVEKLELSAGSNNSAVVAPVDDDDQPAVLVCCASVKGFTKCVCLLQEIPAGDIGSGDRVIFSDSDDENGQGEGRIAIFIIISFVFVSASSGSFHDKFYYVFDMNDLFLWNEIVLDNVNMLY